MNIYYIVMSDFIYKNKKQQLFPTRAENIKNS